MKANVCAISILTSLKVDLNEEGVIERLHGNKRRVPVNTTTYGQTKEWKLLIENHENVNAINILNRVSRFSSENLMETVTFKVCH